MKTGLSRSLLGRWQALPRAERRRRNGRERARHRGARVPKLIQRQKHQRRRDCRVRATERRGRAGDLGVYSPRRPEVLW